MCSKEAAQKYIEITNPLTLFWRIFDPIIDELLNEILHKNYEEAKKEIDELKSCIGEEITTSVENSIADNFTTEQINKLTDFFQENPWAISSSEQMTRLQKQIEESFDAQKFSDDVHSIIQQHS